MRNSTFVPMALQKNVKIKNRKARFEYEVLDTYSAGIVLAGAEIKAIREGKASIAESFCEFHNSELNHLKEFISRPH